jgi:hypothetical protein
MVSAESYRRVGWAGCESETGWKTQLLRPRSTQEDTIKMGMRKIVRMIGGWN